MTYPKSAQTKKSKKINPKKLSACQKMGFINTIDSLSGGYCQLCTIRTVADYHHSIYGSFGADKDDRSLMAICEVCHYEIHHGKNGIGQTLREDAIEIGANNWRLHSDET